MRASILTIGDEILNGSILDTNSKFIADNSIREGIDIVNILSVSDSKEEIFDGLNFLSEKSEIIFVTGGLGPTKDDITVKTLASFLNVSLEFNQEVYDKILFMLSERSLNTIEISKESCSFPKGVELLKNKKGTAPCMWLKNGSKIIVSMPGVPLEMKQIFLEEVLPKVQSTFGKDTIINRYILTAGIWESVIAKEIKDIEDALPKEISLAYLPKLGQVTLRLTGKNIEEKIVQNFAEKISKRLENFVYSTDENINLAQAVGNLLLSKNKTLSTAESCTGGKIAHKLTSNSGSSAYFEGTIVSYSNNVKMNLLNVQKSTLGKFGAVSKQTVKEMAKEAIKTLNTDYSIAVSGIAGPTGGTELKPVGTVWIAVASKEKIETKKFQFWPFRKENIELSSIEALNMLRNLIK